MAIISFTLDLDSRRLIYYVSVRTGKSRSLHYHAIMGEEVSKMADVSNLKIQRTIPFFVLIALVALSPVKAQAQDGTPVADAGLPRYAATDPVQLDGTRSHDPDESGPLSYSWR